MSEPETPTFVEVLRAWASSLADDLHFAIPATVTAVAANRATVTVRPFYRRPAKGDVPEFRLPDLQDVPVASMSDGVFIVQFPLAAGATGMLLVADQAIGPWFRGVLEPNAELGPTHSVAGAVFLPILPQSTETSPELPDTDGLYVGRIGGPSVVIDGSLVRLGGPDASQAAMLGTKAAAWLAGHVHPAVGSPPTPVVQPGNINVAELTSSTVTVEE